MNEKVMYTYNGNYISNNKMLLLPSSSLSLFPWSQSCSFSYNFHTYPSSNVLKRIKNLTKIFYTQAGLRNVMW